MLNIGHETTNVNIVHPVIEHKYICIVAKIKGFVFLSTKNVNKNNKVQFSWGIIILENNCTKSFLSLENHQRLTVLIGAHRRQSCIIGDPSETDIPNRIPLRKHIADGSLMRYFGLQKGKQVSCGFPTSIQWVSEIIIILQTLCRKQ